MGGLVEVRSDTARARTCFAVGSDTARATARFAAGSDTARATARFAVGSDAARFAADQDSILAMGRFEAHGVMGNVRGNSSAVERQPSKLGVAGSNPVSRSSRQVGSDDTAIGRAHVAQLAERVLGKDEVSGSIPDMGSIITDR